MDNVYIWLGFTVFWIVILIGLFGIGCLTWLALTTSTSIFGYVPVREDEYWDMATRRQNLIEARRWMSGFKELDAIWAFLYGDIAIVDARKRYAKERGLTEYGEPLPEVK